MSRLVNYRDRCYQVISTFTADGGIEHTRARPLGFGGKPGRGTDIIVPSSMLAKVVRGSVRHLKGKQPHRDKRPVHMHIDTALETIRVKLKGKRSYYECTFGGLYDVLARQQAMNAKRDRAFKRRTGRK